MIDEKIKTLRYLSTLTTFPYIEYDKYNNQAMYVVDNPHTLYRRQQVPLCEVGCGFEMALDIAIEKMSQFKIEYMKEVAKHYDKHKD